MIMDIFKNEEEIDFSKYFIVKYFIKASEKIPIRKAAENIAIGQSIGNPNIRSKWETDDLIHNHSCLIINSDSLTDNEGFVNLAFPLANIDFNTDGITQMLVQIMGGQLDIDIIEKCQVKNIDFPKSIDNYFLGPRYGIAGIRQFTETYGVPILGGIIKPKIGASSKTLLNIVKELVDGGVNFIKEDEIMSNPQCCPIEERVPIIMDYLKDKKVIYAVSISSDFPYVIDRVKLLHKLGANAIHINFWNGLGVYNAVRKMNLPMFLFFQKSGDKILTNTNHAYHIEWSVICKLAAMMGVDFIHAGMWGGYLNDNEDYLRKIINLLNRHNVMPSLSCGMHPGLIKAINKRFGIDYMANVGGAIHGHPDGSKSGALALRQAIDEKYGDEYFQAIKKWGKVE